MFSSAYDIRVMKRLARAFIALVFLTANITPSYAQTIAGSTFPQRGAASYAGPASMLGVRIPFGGEGTASSQPMIGLRFGSAWQSGPGSTSPQAYRFVPAVEAGLSFRGDPILKLSSFEVLDRLRAAAEGAERQTFCGRHLSLCILGGVAIGVVRVYTGEPRQFAEAERQFLRAIAELGAIAIDNARVYETPWAELKAIRREKIPWAENFDKPAWR